MKGKLLALAIVGGFAALAGPALATAYCDGYQAGYKAGFCAEKLVCYGGNPPGCPASHYAVDNYQTGYNRGYSDGAAAARRSR